MIEQKNTPGRLQLPSVIGHRGASGYAPENTLAAVRKAYELNVQWIEVDVMLSRDNEVIAIHDVTVNRTTNGQGYVATMSYTELLALDAGSWFSTQFTNEKIPKLEQIINYAKPRHLGINLEIKTVCGYEQKTALSTYAVLEQCGFLTQDKLLLSSFSVPCLEKIRCLNKNLNIGLLLEEWTDDWQANLEALNCISLHADWHILNPSRVMALKEVVQWVLAYTVDDPETAAMLYSWGIDGLFSNYPDQLFGHYLR